jgi:hypothetical protein
VTEHVGEVLTQRLLGTGLKKHGVGPDERGATPAVVLQNPDVSRDIVMWASRLLG